MTLQPDFKELLRLLLSHRVRFVIVGAHALAAHGKPRFTGDIDVFVESADATGQLDLLGWRPAKPLPPPGTQLDLCDR